MKIKKITQIEPVFSELKVECVSSNFAFFASYQALIGTGPYITAGPPKNYRPGYSGFAFNGLGFNINLILGQNHRADIITVKRFTEERNVTRVRTEPGSRNGSRSYTNPLLFQPHC